MSLGQTLQRLSAQKTNDLKTRSKVSKLLHICLIVTPNAGLSDLIASPLFENNEIILNLVS